MMTITDEMTIKMAQARKNAFIRAKLSVKCLEENGNMRNCAGCKSFRICREVLELL